MGVETQVPQTAGSGAANPAPRVGNGGGGSIGIGFAIPADYALRIAHELIAKGSVTHAFVTAIDGVQVTDVDQLDTLTVTERPGDKVRIIYRRAGASADANVTLGSFPSPTP